MEAQLTEQPRRGRGRPKKKDDHLDAAREMARALDGKPITMRSLAIIRGVSLATISGWVEEARQTMVPWDPTDADPDFDPDDQVYFEKRYRDSSDPAVKDFLKSIRTPRRRRP